MKKIVFLILILSTCIYSQVERASRWQSLSASLAQQDTTKEVWVGFQHPVIDYGAYPFQVLGNSYLSGTVTLSNGAIFDNSDTDTLEITEVIVKVSGDTKVTGRSLVKQIYHAYGGYSDSNTTVARGAGDWNVITNAWTNLWTLDETDGITEANDTFTLTYAGDYWGLVTITISAINGKDFHIRVYNVTQAAAEGRDIGISTTGAGNEMNVTVPIYIEATAGDVIRFEVSSADGTDAILDDGIFILTYLHD